MTTTLQPATRTRTLADLLHGLDDVPAERVLLHPAPGTATELLAVALASFLRAFVVPRNLGLVSGPDGSMRLAQGLVRIPDVAYISWDRLPGRKVPTAAVPELTGDLVVEILSASNTPGEIARRRWEYFKAGTRLVWVIDPEARAVMVYSAPEGAVTFRESDTLGGGDVLPGFALPLGDLFAELDRQG